MESIEQLIDHLGNGDFATAGPLFQEIMSMKLQDALDAEEIRVASEIYDSEPNEEDEEDDEDYEDDEDDDEEDE